MNNDDFSSMLSSVMSNPEMVQKLRGIASDLSQDNPSPPDNNNASDSADTDIPSPQKPMAENGSDAERKRLITALKPYLNHERRQKADMLLGLLSVLSMTQNAGLLNMLTKTDK